MSMNYFRNISANILVFACGYLGMLFLQRLNQYLNIASFQLPVYIGNLLIVIVVSIRIWASIAFSKSKVEIFGMLGIDDHRKLIISGPYQYSRNPLYVGIVLITLGFALLAGSFVGLILTFLFFIFWDYLIKSREEPELENIFGDEYLNYKLKVNRWI